MPVVPSVGKSLVGQRQEMPKLMDTPEPSGLDITAAAFRQSNFVSSFIASSQDRASVPQQVDSDDYDVWSAIKDTPYADYADRFEGDETKTQAMRLMAQIDRESDDRKTLEAAGFPGFVASMAAGISDPVTLLTAALPGGYVKGASRLANAGRVALMGGVAEIPVEAALQSTQATRTTTDAVLNIGGATLLSGILGGALGRTVEARTLGKRLQEEIEPAAPVPNEGISTVGAASTRRMTTLEQEGLAKGARKYAQTMGRINPVMRLLSSQSKATRELAQELVEVPLQLQKNLEGIATPTAVETTLKRHMGDWWVAYRERTNLYKQMRGRLKEEGQPVPSRREFNEMVSQAMRRGDAADLPEVAKAAAFTRSIVIDPLKKQAQKLGLLGDQLHVTGADSYIMRQYDYRKIRSNQKEWLDLLVRGFKQQGLDDNEAASVAYDATRTITGSETGTLDNGVVAGSGRLKERTINLPDELLEPFLVNDIDTLSQAYLRTLGPEVHITQRFGDRDMKDAVQKIKDDYAVRKERARGAGNTDALNKLDDGEKNDLDDLMALRDRLYGTYGAPKDPGQFFVRAGRLLRAVNYTRLLGGQVISAMTDAARMMMIYGAPKMMASAAKLSTNMKALGIGRNQARRMAIGLDLVLNTRGVAMGDLAEHSSFLEQRIAKRVSDVFSIASLQSPWNAVMKSWASVMSQDDVLRAAKRIAAGESINNKTMARMASLGLDQDGLKAVAKQFEKHGTEEGGLKFGNSDAWTDKTIQEIYENAILREADTAILTPGAGDLPLVYSSEWGKVLLQFKSFAIASTTRLVGPMLQGVRQGDLRTMSGMVGLFGLSAAVYTLKQLAADQPIEKNPTRFAREVIDRSGVLAWGGDIIFPALWQFGSDDLSRWSDREPIETMLGPSAGTLGDVFANRWPTKIREGEVSEKDVHKLRRLMPGQNLWYARRAINALEEEFSD